MLLDIALGLFAAAVIVAITGTMARRFIVHHDMAEQLRAEFFSSAKKLTLDERVPDEVARMVDIMADQLRRSRFLRRFAWHILVNGVRRNEAFARLMARMNEGQRAAFTNLIFCFGMAVTYNNAVLGVILRRIFLLATVAPRPRPDDSRVEALARDLARCEARAA